MLGNRSTFVSVIAAVFASMAALSMLGAVSQLVAILSMGGLLRDFGISPAVLALPIAGFAYYAFELYVSVQLFRRRAWARRVFIWIRALSVVAAAVALLALVGVVGWTIAEGARIGPGEMLIQLLIAAFVGALALLQLWIIRRLKRPEVIAEFDSR